MKQELKQMLILIEKNKKDMKWLEEQKANGVKELFDFFGREETHSIHECLDYMLDTLLDNIDTLWRTKIEVSFIDIINGKTIKKEEHSLNELHDRNIIEDSAFGEEEIIEFIKNPIVWLEGKENER